MKKFFIVTSSLLASFAYSANCTYQEMLESKVPTSKTDKEITEWETNQCEKLISQGPSKCSDFSQLKRSDFSGACQMNRQISQADLSKAPLAKPEKTTVKVAYKTESEKLSKFQMLTTKAKQYSEQCETHDGEALVSVQVDPTLELKASCFPKLKNEMTVKTVFDVNLEKVKK